MRKLGGVPGGFKAQVHDAARVAVCLRGNLRQVTEQFLAAFVGLGIEQVLVLHPTRQVVGRPDLRPIASPLGDLNALTTL